MTKKEQKYMKHLMDNKDSYQLEIYNKLEKMAETIEDLPLPMFYLFALEVIMTKMHGNLSRDLFFDTIEQTADEIDAVGNTVNNNNNISLN